MLDDFLETISRGQRKRGHSGQWRSEYDHHDGHHKPHFGAEVVLGALRAITRNKLLLAGLVLSLLFVLVLAVWVVVTLLSLSGPLVDFVGRSGVKGVVETFQTLVQKLWEGTGK